jgi:ABC-type glycerol-3-phosphate transport system substrate-binding protein
MKAFPALPGGRQILTDALAPEIQAAILGEKSAKEALDAAAARAKDIITEQSKS